MRASGAELAHGSLRRKEGAKKALEEAAIQGKTVR